MIRRLPTAINTIYMALSIIWNRQFNNKRMFDLRWNGSRDINKFDAMDAEDSCVKWPGGGWAILHTKCPFGERGAHHLHYGRAHGDRSNEFKIVKIGRQIPKIFRTIWKKMRGRTYHRWIHLCKNTIKKVRIHSPFLFILTGIHNWNVDIIWINFEVQLEALSENWNVCNRPSTEMVCFFHLLLCLMCCSFAMIGAFRNRM